MLDISPVLLLISAIVFLLVLAGLNSYLYTPLMKHMDERDEGLKKDLESVQSGGADIEAYASEANDVISAAKAQAAQIREAAVASANEIAQSKLNVAKSEAEEKYNSFVETMKVERESLKQGLSAAMPQFKDSLNAKVNSI